MSHHYITIIDYGAGNLHSIEKAFASQATTNDTIIVSGELEHVKRATHIVLPGVGAFADCMAGLKAISGLVPLLNTRVQEEKIPFFGVCVGMQMLAEKGLENGTHQGLGWIKGQVNAITPQPGKKIPHMGWNTLSLSQNHPVLNGIEEGDHAYFVHSYHFECDEKEAVIARTDYCHPITAILAKDNIVATQFHPEKSQDVGLRIIKNFLVGGV